MQRGADLMLARSSLGPCLRGSGRPYGVKRATKASSLQVCTMLQCIHGDGDAELIAGEERVA